MAYLPSHWGNGILFAFSGMDGQTSWAHPLVGSTRDDPPGIFFPNYDAALTFDEGTRVGTARLAGSDVADLDLVDRDGHLAPTRLVFQDCHTLLCESALPVALRVAEGPPLALVTPQGAGGVLRSALAFHAKGTDAATAQARAALDVDFDATFADRVAFFDRLPPLPAGTEERLARLYAKACSVLKVNAMTPEGKIARRWTTPDRWPHRDMWLWDSAFHAPAYARLDPAWGQDALLAVLEMQHDDGFIAHQMRPGWTSKITQPPVLAWACWEVYQISRDRAFLKAAYPPLCRYLEWDLRNRDWNGDGLLGWWIGGNPLSRSGESGMDNSPRFDPDGPWNNVDFCSYAVSDMRSVARIARELGREGQAAQWDKQADAMGTKMNALLWDEDSGFYYDRKVNGEMLLLKSNAGILPLFAGVASETQAARVVAHLTDPDEFWSPMPVPTIALDEASYQVDMWRGPTWVNINSLIRLGLERYGYRDLSQAIRHKNLEEIDRWYQARGCIYEYYDCMGQLEPRLLNRKGAPGKAGGTGFGVIADYNWTAAWTVLMLLADS